MRGLAVLEEEPGIIRPQPQPKSNTRVDPLSGRPTCVEYFVTSEKNWNASRSDCSPA